MGEKVTALISKITVNSPVLTNVVIEPTLINYFYGKNGTGKSTIARVIAADSSLEWSAGSNPDDYEICVYNEQYIQENIQSYGNIPGVFTITKQNAEIKAKVDEKTEKSRQFSGDIKRIQKDITEIRKASEANYERFMVKVWNATEIIRRKYPKAFPFSRDKKKFVDALLTMTPAAVNEEELKALYSVAYGADAPQYPELRRVSGIAVPTSPLLEEPIISSATTEFAIFVKRLNATAWIKQAHKEYQHKAGELCPYCQQRLPNDFEKDLASCFDEQYQNGVKELQEFIRQYEDAMDRISAAITANKSNAFSCEESDTYTTVADLFTKSAEGNVRLLNDKESDPSKVVTLEDLSEQLKRLDEIAEQINQKIRQNNAAAANKPQTKSQCGDLVWAMIATTCQADVEEYRREATRLQNEQDNLTNQKEAAETEKARIDAEISQMNKQTVNTTAAKDGINALIRSTGLQGFHLIDRPGAQYVYQLVRDDGNTACNLSEGERNFIAFLYFYQMIMGSQTDDGKVRNKIVVIDDPVSSMDSGTLFTIASLVRHMIAVCYNNYALTEMTDVDDHIRQIFCLTHNPFFFKEIAYDRVHEYECVSLFEIKKGENNQSTIKPCIRDGARVGDGPANYSPVINAYEQLWQEYRDSSDSVAIMNVTRRILEYYFLQICGYIDAGIRKTLLEDHRDVFESNRPDGTVDQSKYNAVAAMISILGAGTLAFNDGLYYDASAVDPGLLKDTFKLIFTAMGQEQHYKMMMLERMK